MSQFPGPNPWQSQPQPQPQGWPQQPPAPAQQPQGAPQWPQQQPQPVPAQQPQQWPQQQPQAAPPQPMPQQPQWPQQPMPQQQPQSQWPQQQVAPAQAPAGGMPAYFMPSEEEIAENFRKEAEKAGNFDQVPFVKFLNPRGESSWENVPQHYKVSLRVYLAPPWAAGKGLFRAVRSHFIKSSAHPRGTSIVCLGAEQCLICQARERAFNSADEMLKKHAKEYGRVRTQFLYNCFLIDQPDAHWDQTRTKLRPFILGAPRHLHMAMHNIIQARQGVINVIDPVRGRPLEITKHKKGASNTEVEYLVIDCNPQPLPQFFWPALSNLWDLDALDKPPTQEQMLQAVQELRLPMPGSTPQASVPGGGGFGAFQQPQQPQQPFQQQSQQPFQQQSQQPFQQQFSAPPQPVVQNNVNFQSSWPNQAPENLNPPPVQSHPSAVGAFAPQPSQGGSVVLPTPTPTPGWGPAVEAPAASPWVGNPNPSSPPPGAAQGPSQAPGGPFMIPFPVPAGLVLPDSRERCYGNFTPGHFSCGSCPQWVQSQCQAQAMGAQARQAQAGGQSPASLEQLTQQLIGR